MDRQIAGLEDKIGYVFQDAQWLARALTHASERGGPGTESYQRLEFLGDRVLALAIVDELLRLFPNAEEGELSIRLNQLVCRESCAVVAEDFDLFSHLRIETSENLAGRKARQSVLADVCEALIGAIYLDGGLAPARDFVLKGWQSLLTSSAVAPDAKTALQEWLQGRGLPLPDYQIRWRSGPDHEPRFTVIVHIKSLTDAVGRGTTKREAEQSAAKAVLEREGVSFGPHRAGRSA